MQSPSPFALSVEDKKLEEEIKARQEAERKRQEEEARRLEAERVKKLDALMKSPLSVDKDTATRFRVTPDLDVPPVAKLGFLQEQLAQLQHMLWRSRVDIIHATRLSLSENEVLKNKGLQNLGTHINEVQQSVGAIQMIHKLIEELREEYPELKVEA